MNILIVGAGIAGLTCAGLLKKQGKNFTIIEKESSELFNTSGYMLGLLPMGMRVLTALDLQETYFEHSIEMSKYEIHKENGDLIKAFDLDFINKDYGSYRSIGREALVDILVNEIGREHIRFGTTVKHLQQIDNEVEVTFSDGKQESFDVVIVADGIHSQTRSLLWNKDEYEYFDTHWGGWVAWINDQQTDTYKEYWGAGSFMGMYPVKDHMGVFLGGPNNVIKKMGVSAFCAQIKEEISDEYPILHQALDSLVASENPFYWELHDVRTKEWNKGNVILLGDAASGFLPTAGVGASMAMDSAAALVDELSRTDKDHIGYGLKLYIKRQQKRVELNQEDSRQLGKMMFIESPLLSAIRDYAMRFYTVKQMVKNISKTIEG